MIMIMNCWFGWMDLQDAEGLGRVGAGGGL